MDLIKCQDTRRFAKSIDFYSEKMKKLIYATKSSDSDSEFDFFDVDLVFKLKIQFGKSESENLVLRIGYDDYCKLLEMNLVPNVEEHIKRAIILKEDSFAEEHEFHGIKLIILGSVKKRFDYY